MSGYPTVTLNFPLFANKFEITVYTPYQSGVNVTDQSFPEADTT